MQVLLVDEKEETLEQVKDFFEDEEQFKMITCFSAEKAFEQMKEDDFDVIVSGYELSDLDGLEFLEILREKRDDDVPFILLTDNDSEDIAIRALNLGADSYVKKGSDLGNQFETLTAVIKREVRKKKRVDKLKKEKEQLKEDEKKYRSLIEQADEMLFLHDTKGNILEVNEAAVKQTGYSRSELLEKNVTDIDPDAEKRGDQENFWKELTTQDPTTKIEVRHERKDGSIYPAEVILSKVELSGDEYIFALARDMTERKKAENKILETKDKIENLHKISTKLLTRKSEDEIFDLAARAASNILDFDICSFAKVEGNKFVVKKRTAGLPKDGYLERPIEEGGIDTKTYLNKQSYLIKDMNKEKEAKPVKSEYRSALSIPIGDYGVFQAVSTEKDYFDNEDLEMAEILINHIAGALKGLQMREREEFLHSLLRHDVRNKAVLIEGYLSLMEEHDLSGELKQYVKRSQNALKNCIEIIDKVRALRKIKEQEDISNVDLKSAIDVAISKLEDRLKDNDIEIDIEEQDITVKGGSLLEELFSNIIENSIIHSGCDKIKISVRTEGERCVIKIEDDGKGIREKDKDKVFEKGYKTGENAGTGLGMYMVKEIAHSYGGNVEIKDSDLGGARFDVSLKRTHP